MKLPAIIVAALLLAAAQAVAEPTYHETEPNNEPADFHAIDGEVSLSGTMLGGDQDGYLWSVSDNDARKRWNFELQGIPGALTITDIVVLDYADNGVDVTGKRSIMKMGSRDGAKPDIRDGLIFEPGEYVLGFAQMGAGSARNTNAAYRPPMGGLSFVSEDVTAGEAEPAAEPTPDKTDGAYRFLIRKKQFNVRSTPGVRDTRDKAYKVRPGGQIAWFESHERAWYKFEFSDQQAQNRWDIHVQVPVGRSATATLYDADGNKLSEARTDKPGRLRFPDLAPPVGTWYLEVEPKDPGFIIYVGSEAVGQRVAGEEAEPNNTWATANRVDLSQPLTGKVGGDDSHDYFFFDVDEASAGQLLSLRSQTEPEAQHQLCVTTADTTQLQCKRGIGQVELPDLLLSAGTWGMRVERAAETNYTVTLEVQGPVESGREVEPNDTRQFASAVPGNLRIKGRFVGEETDHYRFLVPGDPQLWRFQVIGDGVQEVRHYDGGGTLRASISPRGERRIRMENLFLLPGRHTIRVKGKDGDYTLLARPLGPPDPNGEIEPNDEHNKQRLMIGQTRRGLLSERNDVDTYRFFVANWDHLKLTIQPPPDGSIGGNFSWYAGTIGQLMPGGPGEPLTWEGLFPPGDYTLRLESRKTSDADYKVSLERLPRFTLPADSEPNGQGEIYLAAPLPKDLILEGNSGHWRDRDYYQLPAFDNPTEILLRTPEKVNSMAIGTHYRVRQNLSYDAELGGYRATIPAGPAHRIMLDSRKKPYRIQLEFPGGELVPVTGALLADLKLELDHKAVSAYRSNGQRVTGTLKIANTGAAPLRATLEAVTSDFRWAVASERSDINVSPGGSLNVPVEVLAPADAWADVPVRISARLLDATGRQAETWQDIAVEREIPPVSPYLYWAMPEELRGGFNAAWLAFGGEWTNDTPKTIRTETMRDNIIFPRMRVDCCSDGDGWADEERPLITIDLPGNEPVPVRGVAINHFGTPGPFNDIRSATLLLSLDGITFDEVLDFETIQINNEQQFALDAPVFAKFARLRVNATFREPSANRLFTAEWKVILEPGHDLSGGKGFNIADKKYGGHVAWDWPPKPYKPNSVVVEDKNKGNAAHLARSMTKDYVIGFNENRAAQITRIEWRHSDSTAIENRNWANVAVSASTESSVGPWLLLGEFDLSDGRVEGSLDLAAPTWARFVRLTATRKEGGRAPNPPDVIRIWERPTGDEYRSVLTEWGDLTSRAYYEQLAGLQAEAALTPVNNDSKQRAAALAVEQVASGQVSLGRQEHWYRVTMPAGDNTLKLQLEGDPTVRTRLKLEDSGGEEILFKRTGNGETPAKHLMEAIVDAGSDVWINVAEPPRNVVFTWDTSASVSAYIPVINNALVAFSSQVVPGREAVNLMPFNNTLLLDEWYGEPYMLQTTLNDYRRVSSSSSAHTTLKRATRAMQNLPGTKAVVMITDADSPNDGGVWGPLQDVQPRVFGIGVAGDARYQQDNLRDWAYANGGHFTQLRYDGEMEIAFDRATTLMHRPAAYRLLASSEYREAPGPGLLSVVHGGGGGGGGGAAGGAAVELILDASGSMLKRIGGSRRIIVAKEVLTEAVQKHIPAGTPVALRVFGHKEVDSCRTDLEIPLAPLDPAAAASKIAGINAMNLARTPIADSLAAVEKDLKGAKTGTIVLVTDGEETCDGDPGAVIEALRAKGFDVSLNIVGFAIDDAELAAQFEAWAELGNGRYLAANDADDLSVAIEQALRISYAVYDRGGNEVATGEVGGDAVELERGKYRVVINSVPRKTFDSVTVEGEDSVTLRLE